MSIKRELSRRRADSNYFELDADRRRTRSDRAERFSHRVMTLDASHNRGPDLDFDEISIDFCCQHLHSRFGFQEGSLANQREHVLLLLANCKARSSPTDAPDYHIRQLHRKLFSNYHAWCEFLHTQSRHYIRSDSRHHPLHMEIMLFFLIWGEGSNLRHIPECLCYLYHHMIQLLNTTDTLNEEGWFLHQVVCPIWQECSNMQRRNALGKPLEHVHVRNYDDINEFFWTSDCLNVHINQIGHALSNHTKTFYEHRSFFTLILNYYRIFQFNAILLHILIIVAFLVAVSPNGGKSGLQQFRSLGKTVTPFQSLDIYLSLISIPFTLALLSTFKCVLEFSHTFQHFLNRKSSRIQNVPLYFYSLLLRLLYHSAFAVYFGILIYFPFRDPNKRYYLQHAILFSIIYILPGTCIIVYPLIQPSILHTSFLRKFIRERDACFVGRHMTPNLTYRIQYTIFWLLLWLVKSIVSYSILIRPLMLPSLAIYEMNLAYSVSLISIHNIGVLLAYWAPTVFIFHYDTQIYFTTFQALLGAYQGWRMKCGELHGEKEIAKAFRIAPLLFDQKIVTKLARINDDVSEPGPNTKNTRESQRMLRFVVVWNEIVNSFREGDLLDDKEAAILQYDIRSNGEVFEPVFLSAGKIGDAIGLAVRAHKENMGESQFQVLLVESDCVSAIRSFFTAISYVMEAVFGIEDGHVLDGIRMIEEIACNGMFMRSFHALELVRLRAAALDMMEEILDLPDPDTQSETSADVYTHNMNVVRNFVSKMETLLTSIQSFCIASELQNKFVNTKFCATANNFSIAAQGLLNLYTSDVAMGAATRACLLLSLDKSEAMPRCLEAQRRLGFFMKSLAMDIPQLESISEMRSFSVVTPFYAETVLFSLQELNNPLVNHPIFQNVEEGGKNLTILKYLNKIHPEEWDNFLERLDVSSSQEAQHHYPLEIRLWASYRGQTLARTVQGMMLYEDAIKILHWLEIGSSVSRTAEQKQVHLQDMVRLKFSYICACQVYGKHRLDNAAQADDIDYLLKEYPNLRVAYVDTIPQADNSKIYDTVLIKSENDEIVEVYRYQLPGNPIIGEGKPENQNNAVQFTRGEFVQTIDMNQQHYFEECLKMPQLLRTADLHHSDQAVSIIGMREHIFTGNASSLAKFKTWQELVFVTLSQRVLANPLCVRMHYGHPDIFDKVFALTRGGLSKASKGINLSEDVFAGFNATLRGGIVTHVEFMQCGKGRDVALSQISMFEGKLANGAGETSLAREAYRMGQFMDFFRLHSMYYSHTGFYFATWMTIVTTFIYMYAKVYVALAGVQEQIVFQMNSTQVVGANELYGFPKRAYNDANAVINTQYYIQAGLFLSLPLVVIYFGEMGLRHGLVRLFEMIFTGGPFFFIFQVGTTMHYFDNNLMHGEAQYKATGRGFKITRELYVLLYKAYSASHFRKAFELIGLCLIYRTFGAFHICDRKPEINDRFAFDFCTTSQGFGVQTFAIWMIAITWLLAPYVFNTDGLDFEKTKADVSAWITWMYAEEAYVDEDSTMNGGWLGWWKSELSIFHNSRMIARMSVIFRECRHLLLMYYVITLRWKLVSVVFVLAMVLATLFFLWFLGGLGEIMKTHKPRSRMMLYAFSVAILIAIYFLILSYVFDANYKDSIALFYGYIAALYGINEMARMYSFSTRSIADSVIFQQLAFFFDFAFCAAMIVPLLIMSSVPFLNIIQTRMMYNKGFSQVVSASSQYAFSLAALMGIIGGGGCGWIMYVMSVLEASPGFIGYATSYNLLAGKAGKGTLTYYFYCGAICAALVSVILNHYFGRRLSIVSGGLVAVIGMVCISAVASENAGMLLPGVMLMGISIGILLPTITVYIYEISTKQVRSKSILILGTGVVLGTLIGSLCMSSSHEVGWVWQIFSATILLSLVTPSVFLFPESPYWIYTRYGLDACELCLTLLRRKESVTDELKIIRDESMQDGKLGQYYKFGMGLLFISISGISHQCLSIYMTKEFENVNDTSNSFANCVALQLAGAVLSYFVIDRVDLRRVLLGNLLPIAILAGILGFYASASPWGRSTSYIVLQVIGYALYFFLGLGTSTALWSSCIGFHSTKRRMLMTAIYFIIYFSLANFAVYTRTNQPRHNSYASIYLYALAGLCILSMILLFNAGQLKNGLISTKREMESEQVYLRRLRSTRRSSRTPGHGRSRNASRSRNRSQSAKSGYHLYESPGATGSAF